VCNGRYSFDGHHVFVKVIRLERFYYLGTFFVLKIRTVPLIYNSFNLNPVLSLCVRTCEPCNIIRIVSEIKRLDQPL
jgi:hypothetical protein